MAAARTSAAKIGKLAVLYFSQGLPFGFFSNLVPVVLRQSGASLPAIGLSHLLALPWGLKVLWAPLADKYWWPRLGRRRSWILPAQAALVATALAGGALQLACEEAALPPAARVAFLLALFLLVNLFAAVQDVPVDGMAVDILGPDERGPGNAAQVAGAKVGMLLGGGALLVLATTRGLGWGFFALGAALALAMLVPLFHREGPPPQREAQAHAPVLRSLLAFARTSGGTAALGFVALAKVPDAMSDAMLKPFLVDRGLTPDTIFAWIGGWSMGASLAGSVLGGLLTGPIGRRRSLVLFALATALGNLALGWAAGAGLEGPPLLLAVVAQHFAGGMFTPALFAWMMDQCDPRFGATEYAAYATAEVVGKSVTGPLAGALAHALGWAPFFAGMGALCLLPLALLARAPERAAALIVHAPATPPRG